MQDSKEVATTVQSLLSKANVQDRFNQLLGENAQSFITSVIQTVNNSRQLKEAEPNTVLTAAATAASLGLPIDPNLGFAYIIPYNITVTNDKGQKVKQVVAQFQIGYKGFIQLAQRSGRYQKINAITVYENQFKGFNALTEEINGDFSVPGAGKVVGYAAYFRLGNGYEKLLFSPIELVRAHAKKYSKSFNNNSSLWQDETGGADAMGMKTVLKAILSKYGPLEINIQAAIKADFSIQRQEGEYQYLDNPTSKKSIDIEQTEHDKEKDRLKEFINAAKTVEELKTVSEYVEHFQLEDLFDNKMQILDQGSK